MQYQRVFRNSHFKQEDLNNSGLQTLEKYKFKIISVDVLMKIAFFDYIKSSLNLKSEMKDLIKAVIEKLKMGNSSDTAYKLMPDCLDTLSRTEIGKVWGPHDYIKAPPSFAFESERINKNEPVSTLEI